MRAAGRACESRAGVIYEFNLSSILEFWEFWRDYHGMWCIGPRPTAPTIGYQGIYTGYTLTLQASNLRGLGLQSRRGCSTDSTNSMVTLLQRLSLSAHTRHIMHIRSVMRPVHTCSECSLYHGTTQLTSCHDNIRIVRQLQSIEKDSRPPSCMAAISSS